MKIETMSDQLRRERGLKAREAMVPRPGATRPRPPRPVAVRRPARVR